jgi:hypothetical protein
MNAPVKLRAAPLFASIRNWLPSVLPATPAGPWSYRPEPSRPAGYAEADWETCGECRGSGCDDCDFNGGWPRDIGFMIEGEGE